MLRELFLLWVSQIVFGVELAFSEYRE